MLLKKIRLKNIRSYEDIEISFSIGSVLLSGDIGSGKTSVLLGIEFALFGLQPGQRGASLLRNGETEGNVLIEFEIDGNDIVIERTLKRSKTISQDYCSITINGEKSEISVSELKNKVLCLLNYPPEFSKKQNILYKFTVYTPQEEMKQIILQDSETRMNTLRYVFGVDKYRKILENISIITSKLREEKRLNEGKISNLDQDKFDAISKESELEFKYLNLFSIEKELFIKIEKRAKIQEEQEEISKKIDEKNKLQQEIEKTKIIILNKKQNIIDNRKSLEVLQEQIKELEKLEFEDSKISEIEFKIILLKKEKEKINEVILDINSKINSFNMKIEEAEKLEQKISNLEICPTCLQDVDAIYRANVLNKIHSDISKSNEEKIKLEAQKNILIKKVGEINLDLTSCEKELNRLIFLKIKLQGLEEKKERSSGIEKINLSLESDVQLLNQHIGSLRSSVSELEKFDIIFETKKSELNEALRQEKLVEIKIAELKKEIEVFSRQIDELKLKIKFTEEIKKRLDYISKSEDWMSRNFTFAVSQIEKNVMTKLKSEFSEFFEKWFSMLVSDSFDVSLRDDFTPVIEYQDYELDYTYLSGGERTAVALAYRLSLNQVINSVLGKIKTKDLVILDEPTDGFSEQQLDKIRDVLQELNIKQLIIVSHEQKIEGFVEKVIRFKKENGISRIE
ncbi:MAG: AAA family ATPase [Nanoarchaeota archaeon]|nr:AAA family ATPase [Nanoarchaeota archaeon]